ncbi:MAG: cation:proton antiporter [Candidatus Pacearchaeota archaeon]
MENIFIQISSILVIVLVVSFIMRILKQPLIIGYIISGILIGPLFLNLLEYNEAISVFSEFGITLLLFIVGLHLSPKVIKEVGKISLITGIGQVVFTSLVGYLIGLALGLDPLTSVYVSVALSFSSTIIIMKLLSDKEALDKLYGKISIGFLLVQDLIAILILLIVSSFSNGNNATSAVLTTIIKGGVPILILFPFSYYVLPKLNDFFAKSKELLFVFAVVWGVGLAALFYAAGLSLEVGALIAGVLLSISPYNYEISAKLKPLRDFFIISFFLILGSQMVFSDISTHIITIIILSLFILIGNPVIVMILMGIFGYTKNTGFMAGLTVAQISEFSLILIALGIKVGHLSSEVLSFVTVIGLITIAGSTYMIMYSDLLYVRISKYLKIFEKKKTREEITEHGFYDYVLLGENRVGFSIMKLFIKLKKKYIIIDHNPTRIKKLKERGISCIYGDASDPEFLDDLNITKSKLVVSTIPEVETNMMLLNKIRDKNKNSIVIVTARQISDTFSLYNAGADYVIMPHFSGGEYTSSIIEKFMENKKGYESEKKRQTKELRERIMEGQKHPDVQKD